MSNLANNINRDPISNLWTRSQPDFTVTFYCYMVELYLDKLIDLLADAEADNYRLDIREDQHTGMVFI